MIQMDRKTRALLPILVRTDREVSEIVWLAITHHSTGDHPRRLKCEEHHANDAEHAESPELCYVSDEDVELAMRLSERMAEVLEWAVSKGWDWRQEGQRRPVGRPRKVIPVMEPRQ